MTDTTNTFLFHYVADATPATTAATDLELIGMFNGNQLTNIGMGDFI
jgi:hypothetical protein